MTQEKACAAVDHLFQNLIGLVGGAYNFSLAHLSRGGAVLPPPSGHERQTPPHLNYFRRLDKPKAGSCPQGCCLAVPSSQGTLLVLGADEAAGQPAVVIGRLILAALARELEHLAELEKLRDQAEFGEKIVRSMSSGFMVLRP
ncbi:MAG: hypothetical protein LBS31_08635, partial [Candidatus Adiutrix sp.]|nr:hypothetical protein [Candidatus Adiutrix sp.]